MRISGREYLTVGRRNFFKVGSGQLTVKMHPAHFPFPCTSIFVRLIAVKQYKLSRGCLVDAVIRTDVAGPLRDSHDEKTIVMIPLDVISGFIDEIADIGRIKIDLLCNYTGGIDIIIGSWRYFGFL